VKREKPIRVLVIDDSASNRRAITQILEASTGIEVVDRAADGEEGLKKAHALKPDVITLDLEMPRLDGFSFLRLLMANTPTPVIVLSSYAHDSDVFKALELGAFDFVAKPSRAGKESLETVRAELLEKVRAVRLVRREELSPLPRPPRPRRSIEPEPVVIAVGASTGGPPAIQKLVEAMAGLPVCLLVCQHMPPRFTHAFAERLHKMGGLKVSEAREGDRVRAGQVFIAPGGGHLELLPSKEGPLLLSTPPAHSADKHAPSVDRLFESLARAHGSDAFAVVLTGMGTDGEQGCKAIGKAGGEIWAESEETAVIFGMPQAAIGTGSVSRVLPLGALLVELRARVKRVSDSVR
jgi:two-component system chemotaxis response regulator CheB